MAAEIVALLRPPPLAGEASMRPRRMAAEITPGRLRPRPGNSLQ